MGLNPDGSPPTLSKYDEPVFKAVFQIHQNPVSHAFEISTNAANNPGYNVQISDIHGRSVAKEKIWHGGRLRIDMDQHLPGTYIYTITENNKLLVSGKFIKI